MARLAALTLAVTLVVMTLALRSTEAIQCHECNSAETSSCSDPFAKSHSGIRTCNGKSCTKVKVSNGVTVVVRGCSQDGTQVEDACTDVTVQASLYATALLATVGAAAAALRALY